MRKRNEGVVIAIIVIFAGIMFFLMARLSGNLEKVSQKNKQTQIQDMVTELSSLDYSVYWIGTPPSGLREMLGENLIVVPVDSINDDTMPVGTLLSTVTRTDKDGYSHREHSRNEYADLLLIVVNVGAELSSDDWEIIRKCVVDNSIPIELIGKNNIDDFRSVMLMPHKNYASDDVMFYSVNGVDSVTLDKEEISKGGDDYNRALLTFITEVFKLPRPTPVVVETAEHTDESDMNIIVETHYSDETEVTTEPGVTIESTVIYYYGN